MTTLFDRARLIFGALALMLRRRRGGAGIRAAADGSVNPTASAVQEEQLLQELRQLDGRVTIPDARSATF
jgi:formate dehydrogenase subunit gamma